MAQDTPLNSKPTALALHSASLRYGQRQVLYPTSLQIPQGTWLAIVGPNGCGKSSLLRLLSGAIRPSSGQALLRDVPLHHLRRKTIARQMAFLPQQPIIPEALTVRELVCRGRYPHQNLLRTWGRDDEQAVHAALQATQLHELADQSIQTLSGGQRQRTWLALILAQDTDILLLDEPTTFLDIRHQIDLLDCCARLHAAGRTLVLVLHDLNLAFRYADTIAMMRDGHIICQGTPQQVVTEATLHDVFDLDCRVMPDPESDRPMLIPVRERGL